MSYTPERFMADSGITRDEVEAEKRRMLEEIRLHEPKEARIRRHPGRPVLLLRRDYPGSGAGPAAQPLPAD